MELCIKKLYPDVIIPSYGSNCAAGLDLCSYGGHIVPARTRKLIPTGLSIQWKSNNEYYLRIAPRSGLSVKHCIDIGAGVIDSDYRGEIKICFINNSEEDYNISHGDRIAQGILEQIERFSSITVVNDLDNTTRDKNGFGSTGV